MRSRSEPVTIGAMTQPPIVPGQPPEPQWYPPPASPPPYQQGPYPPPPAQYPQQPVPVYQVQQHDVVGRTAMGTVTVIAVLVGIFCLLPMLICGAMALLGTFSSTPTP